VCAIPACGKPDLADGDLGISPLFINALLHERLPQRVVQQFRQTSTSEGDPFFGYVARRLLVRCGDSEGAVARANRLLVHGCLRELEAFLDPLLGIGNLNLVVIRFVEIICSPRDRGDAGSCTCCLIPKRVKVLSARIFAQQNVIATAIPYGPIAENI
jgi:hypothetical protein